MVTFCIQTDAQTHIGSICCNTHTQLRYLPHVSHQLVSPWSCVGNMCVHPCEHTHVCVCEPEMGHKWHWQVSLWATRVYYTFIFLPLFLSSPAPPPSIPSFLCRPCGIRNVIRNMKQTAWKIAGNFCVKWSRCPLPRPSLSLPVFYLWMISSANTFTHLTQWTAKWHLFTHCVNLKQYRSIVRLADGSVS